MGTSSADIDLLELRLARFGLSWQALLTADGVAKLDQQFLAKLQLEQPLLAHRLSSYRSGVYDLDRLQISALLIDIAVPLEIFIAELFGVEQSIRAAIEQTTQYDPLYQFREHLVSRKARRYRKPISQTFTELHNQVLALCNVEDAADIASEFIELQIAKTAIDLLADESANKVEILLLTQWAKLALTTSDGQDLVRNWMSFSLPKIIDYEALVPIEPIIRNDDEYLQWRDLRSPDKPKFKQRYGFSLSDHRASVPKVQAEIDYCKYCHDHEGDFCSRGFWDKKGQLDKGFRPDAFGEKMEGCPLEEKISEMQWLKRAGHPIASLAMAMSDNPMIPATGHRICNDCMKACIYQKQDPVDIPQVETRLLTDVLSLPWGVEIYGLLTRWNPIRQQQYLQQPYNARKVLVVGMGPAGFSMTHHLLMEGCAVVGIDGLKIEPLPSELLQQPINSWNAICEDLDTRVLYGFGGVAEYGITARWDKNFLKLIYLTLQRHQYFQIFGGVRFGGTMTIDTAWRSGFDHICLATGAGYPKVLEVENSLARGMRQANDFLMALQLTGTASELSTANLQLRLPAVVIGGGLTAIDTATEIQSYYIRQIEKVWQRYTKLCDKQGEQVVRAGYDVEGLQILDEFLNHAEQLQSHKAALPVGAELDVVRLLQSWGGVTIVYRKRLQDAPAYTRNHEEVSEAMREGIWFKECLSPVAAELDAFGHISTMKFAATKLDDGKWMEIDDQITMVAAKSVMVATGTSPNIIYEKEHQGSFLLQDKHYLPHRLESGRLIAEKSQAGIGVKSDTPAAFLTSYFFQNKTISFIGDAHPQYQGSVVKAIASAQHGYLQVMKSIALLRDATTASFDEFVQQNNRDLRPEIVAIEKTATGMTELKVRAPMIVKNYQPGQFFRLQTYEADAIVKQQTRLQIPVQIVSGAGIEGDCIRLLLLPTAANMKLVEQLVVGQSIVLMGPTGAPMHLPTQKNIMIMASRWGCAVMLDVGETLKARGNQVTYVGLYDKASQVDFMDALTEVTDQIIWITQSGESVRPKRDTDISLTERDAIAALKKIHSADNNVDWSQVDELIVLGGAGLLIQVKIALTNSLSEVFNKDISVKGTLTNPMQCMMKGVCGQCLQWVIDPMTGDKTHAVFSCAEQDQPLQSIDIIGMQSRQKQNRVLDQLNSQWLSELC
jgi:NADPH-dependent glutamate synthase beta subunit-like oxidoreductase/NAD(P)H-flavin reductase